MPGFPVAWVITPTRAVPIKDAPFPQISKIPKNSPDFSGGMILAKYDLDRAWIPPWNMPTHTARNQNSHCLSS